MTEATVSLASGVTVGAKVEASGEGTSGGMTTVAVTTWAGQEVSLRWEAGEVMAEVGEETPGAAEVVEEEEEEVEER